MSRLDPFLERTTENTEGPADAIAEEVALAQAFRVVGEALRDLALIEKPSKWGSAERVAAALVLVDEWLGESR